MSRFETIQEKYWRMQSWCSDAWEEHRAWLIVWCLVVFVSVGAYCLGTRQNLQDIAFNIMNKSMMAAWIIIVVPLAFGWGVIALVILPYEVISVAFHESRPFTVRRTPLFIWNMVKSMLVVTLAWVFLVGVPILILLNAGSD